MKAVMRRRLLILPAMLVVTAAAAGLWYARHHGDALARASALQREANLRGAQLVLRDFVRHYPNRADGHMQLGRLELRLDDPLAAEHELRAAVEHGADEHAVRPLLAQALVGSRQEAAVLRDFDTDGLDPAQAADLHTARAIAALALKQPERARQEAAAAQAAQPQSAAVALSLARIAQAGGDLAAAAQAVDKALTLDPHSYAALVVRAQLLTQQGQADAALAAYDAALAEPSGQAADRSVVRLARGGLNLSRGNDAAARADIVAVLNSAPRNPRANYLMAVLDAHDRKWQDADEALTAAGPSLEKFPFGDMLLATVKANIGQPSQALDAAERFYRRHPTDPAGAKLLARLDLTQGRAAEAAQLLAPWRDSGQEDADVLAILSQAYAMSGQGQQAQVTLRQAASISQGDAGALTGIARVALREGNAPLAADLLQTVLDRQPGAPKLQRAALQPTAPAQAVQVSTTQTGTHEPSLPETEAALVSTALRAGEFDRAAGALEKLRAAHGDPVQLDVLTGALKLAQFDLAGARTAFESARLLRPDLATVAVDLARVLRLQGDTDAAGRLLQEAIARHPGEPLPVLAAIELAMSRNQPDAAIATAEAAHQASPGNLSLTSVLGNLYLRTGQPAKALALADTLPADAPAQLALRADAQRALGHLEEAVTAWQALLAHTPQDLPLRRRIVSILMSDKHDSLALPFVTAGLAAHPDDPALQSAAVALAARQGGLDAGLARADAFAATAKSLPTRLLKGDLLLTNQKYAEAAAAFAAVRTALPTDASPAEAETILLRQTLAMNSGGARDQAEKLLQDYAKSHPASPLLLEALAEGDLSAGRLDAARSGFETVLHSQPNNPIALNNLAWILQQQGHLDASQALATRAFALAPSMQSADTLGWIMLAEGRVPDALSLLREAAGGPQHDPAVIYHLAAALQKAGKADDAKAVLKPVIAAGVKFREWGDAEQLMQALDKS